MAVSIDLTNTERRVSTAEFALRMNISEKELYDRIKTGRVTRPIKDGRKNYWLNSYVLSCIIHEENSILTSEWNSCCSKSKTPDFSQAYFFNIFIHPIVKFLSNMMTLVFKRSSRSIKLKRSQIKFVTFFVTNSNVSNIMSKLNKYCLNIIKLQ